MAPWGPQGEMYSVAQGLLMILGAFGPKMRFWVKIGENQQKSLNLVRNAKLC